MRHSLSVICLLIFCLVGVIGCMDKNQESRTAMIDVEAIINTGPHAQQATKYLQEAQAIFQYNLNVIDKTLSTYKNKDQARAYLIEAARQLQMQLNTAKSIVTQSLLQSLGTVLDGQKSAYSLIVKKDGIIYIEEGEGDAASKFSAMPQDITVKVQALFAKATVEFPPLPNKIDAPNLPADLGEGVPFPPQATNTPDAADAAKKDEKSDKKDDKKGN